MQLYEYQKKAIEQIENLFKDKRKILLQLPTGGGKTFVFSFFTKDFIKENNKRVLILCHREELIEQTKQSLISIGVTVETIHSKNKKALHNSQVYIAMEKTAENRLITDNEFFKNVGLVIADECHELRYEKIFKYFNDSKILGVTATPVHTNKHTFYKCNYCPNISDINEACHNEEMQEWSRPFTFSEIYEDIVSTVQVQELIDNGSLVQDINFIRTPKNIDNLKTDSSGDFTNKSMDSVYANDEQSFNVLLNYKEICEGKKTIIFTSSTKVNQLLLKQFEGYNVRSYDSVYNNPKERTNVVNWFKNNSDAILINTGVFTTGFDVRDVQAIIVNRPTQSLSLFLQMVGRGGRCTRGNEIYKDNFIVVDGGGNIERFGHWSENKDWRNIFFNGLSKPKAKKEPLDLVKDCNSCGALVPKTATICPECNYEFEIKIKTDKEIGSDVATMISKVPAPKPEKIYNYTKRCNESRDFAWKILINQITDLFVIYQITKEQYLAKGENRIYQIVKDNYFYIQGSDLESGVRRTLKYLTNKITEKLNAKYGITNDVELYLDERN